MSSNLTPSRVISFGPFEVDLRTQELKKHGTRLRLVGQPFQILQMLLRHPGELVTREELKRELWSEDTHVDFERGLNMAVNRLRETLGDSAERPGLIETVPRRGYRFIGTVTPPTQPAREQPPARIEPAADKPHPTAPDNRKTPVSAPRLLFVLAALGAVAIAFVYFKSPSRPVSEVFTPLPFTAFAGVETYPTFSPDGAQIAFAWDDPVAASKGFDLYAKVIGSEKLLRLTQHPSEFVHPAWSPDGTQIAFLRGGPDSGLYLVSALGGPERKLRAVQMPYEAFSAIAWSPDGGSIAFSEVDDSTGGDVRLNLLSVKTLQSVRVPHQSACSHEGFPAFSSKGNQLAYVCVHNYGVFGLYRAGLDGTRATLVTTFSGWPIGITWKRNDAAIILAQDQGSGGELFEGTISDRSIKKLPLGQDTSWPALSRDGNKLAYAHGSENVNIWRKDLSQPNAPPVKLISSTREQSNPQYSPDGSHIAFESIRNGNREIWICDSDGANLVQLSHFNYPATGTPHWSPDNETIAFDTRFSGKAEIYTAGLSDLQPQKLVTNLAECSEPSWSHDGKWIYCISSAEDGQRLYRVPARGGDAERLSNSRALGPLESADGKSILFAAGLDTSNLKRVFPDKPAVESAIPGMPGIKDASLWTLDSRGIYFVPADSPQSISFYDFATKRVRVLASVDKPLRSYIGGLSVSSDGSQILFSKVDEQSGDIFLVEHFH